MEMRLRMFEVFQKIEFFLGANCEKKTKIELSPQIKECVLDLCFVETFFKKQVYPWDAVFVERSRRWIKNYFDFGCPPVTEYLRINDNYLDMFHLKIGDMDLNFLRTKIFDISVFIKTFFTPTNFEQ